MEQWEREYQSIIRDQKQREARSKHPSVKQREYINACWEEIEQPDGSKLYVPKQKALKKQEKRQRTRLFLLTTTKKAGKTLLFTSAALIIFFAAAHYGTAIPNGTTAGDSHLNPAGILSGLKLPNTYKNGIGMRDMAAALEEIRKTQTETLSSYIAGSYSFSDEEMAAWQDSIHADLHTIAELAYDESYSELVNTHTTMLTALRSFIDASKDKDWKALQAAHEEYVRCLEAAPRLFAAALDKNNVEYTLHEDGDIFFRYYLH